MTMEAATALSTLVSLAGIFFMLNRLRAVAVDHFRHRICALRDDLFDRAAAGAIAFGHPAYGMLRRTMNGFLRWGERIRLLDVVLLPAFTRHGDRVADNRFDARWMRAVADLSERDRAWLESYRNRIGRVVMGFLIVGSPVFAVTLVIPLFLRVFRVAVVALMERQAFEFGSNDAAVSSLRTSPATSLS